MVCTMEKILSRYGSLISLIRTNETVQFRGFLQPFRSKSQRAAQVEQTPLGKAVAGQYVLLAPPSAGVCKGDTVGINDRKFTVRRLEQVMVTDTVAYCWGLCVEKGGDDIWGY